MEWFKHDIGAFRDAKVQQLRLECGGAAVDAYYAVLELIYEREKPIEIGETVPETKSVCFWLCVGFAGFLEWVLKMGEIGLLEVTEKTESVSYIVDSARARNQIGYFNKRKETARRNGKLGGRPKGSKTNWKANETESVSDKNRKLTDSKPNKEKEEEDRLVGKTNQPTYQGVGSAAAVMTAPPTQEESSRPVCPLCSSPVTFSPRDGGWSCPLCGTIKEPRYEAWKERV